MTALLSVRARRVAVSVLACCAVFVGVVGSVVLTLPAAQRLDSSADLAVLRAVGQHQGALRLVAAFGERAAVGILAVVLVGLCLALRRFSGALLAAIAIPVAPGLTEYVLKPMFAQHEAYGTFPSGHTTAAFAIATVVAVLLAGPGTRMPGVLRLVVALVVLLLGAAVIVAVIGLEMHTLTDALGGAAVGAGVPMLIAVLLDTPVARQLLTLAAGGLVGLVRWFKGSPSGTSGPAG
jgi:membrane-associated phospholipid phosphatase